MTQEEKYITDKLTSPVEELYKNYTNRYQKLDNDFENSIEHLNFTLMMDVVKNMELLFIYDAIEKRRTQKR